MDNNQAPQGGILTGVYLQHYKRALLIGMPIAMSVLVFLTFISRYFSPYHWNMNILGITFRLGGGVVSSIVGIITGTILVWGIITLVFICLQKFNVDLSHMEKSDEAREADSRIKPAGPIGEIITSILLAVLFLGVPFIMSARFEGRWISIFDTAALRALWLPIIVWSGAEIVTEVAKLIKGRYSWGLCAFTVAGGIVCVICAFIVFGDAGNILNPEFLAHLYDLNLYADVPYWVISNIAMQPNRIVLGVMLIVIFFEVIDVVWYTAKAKL